MRAWVRGSVCSTTLLLAVQAAEAAARAPAPHQLWVSHLLAGLVAALLGYVVGRQWALAGMAVVGAVWYALSQMAGPVVPPEALAQFGDRYPFHVQATSLIVPLMVLAGIGARRQLPDAL